MVTSHFQLKWAWTARRVYEREAFYDFSLDVLKTRTTKSVSLSSLRSAPTIGDDDVALSTDLQGKVEGKEKETSTKDAPRGQTASDTFPRSSKETAGKKEKEDRVGRGRGR